MALWKISDIDTLCEMASRGEKAISVAMKLSRTVDAVIVRGYSLGFGWYTVEGVKTFKSGINHYTMSDNERQSSARTVGSPTSGARIVLDAIANSIKEVDDKDRHLYDLLSGLNIIAQRLIASSEPTPMLEELLDTDTAPVVPTIIISKPKETKIYVEAPVQSKFKDVSDNEVIKSIMSTGDARNLFALRKGVGGAFFRIGDGKYNIKESKEMTLSSKTMTLIKDGVELSWARQTYDESGKAISIAGKGMSEINLLEL